MFTHEICTLLLCSGFPYQALHWRLQLNTESGGQLDILSNINSLLAQ